MHGRKLYIRVMPELPEVETVVRGLKDPLGGKIVLAASLNARDLYRTGSLRLETLAGRRISGVERMGKAIVLRLGGPDVLVIHLGMTGRLVVEDGADVPGTALHRHAEMKLTGDSHLVYYDPRRFGYFWVGRGDDLPGMLNIGPDPFQIRVPAFRKILERSAAPVKSILLNQRLVSGLGNIYADESLFRAGIHPLSPGRTLGDGARRLLGAIRAVLRDAIRRGGSTIRDYRAADGSRGRFQDNLRVYGRGGERCFRCGTPVERVVAGGRSTHFCPSCQRGSD